MEFHPIKGCRANDEHRLKKSSAPTFLAGAEDLKIADIKAAAGRWPYWQLFLTQFKQDEGFYFHLVLRGILADRNAVFLHKGLF